MFILEGLLSAPCARLYLLTEAIVRLSSATCRRSHHDE